MSLVPPHIAAIKPYVPGKPMAELERELGLTSTIKLASNENPLGPSPKVMRALREVHYDGCIIPDHIPQMLGGSRPGLAYSIAYMKALVQAVNNEYGSTPAAS